MGDHKIDMVPSAWARRQDEGPISTLGLKILFQLK
jgi:hypothetical protein